MSYQKRYLIIHNQIALKGAKEKMQLLMEIASTILHNGNVYLKKHFIPSVRYEFDANGRNIRAVRGHKKILQLYYTYQGISVAHLLNRDSVISLVRLDSRSPTRELALFGKVFTGIAQMPDYLEKRGIFHYRTEKVLTVEQAFSLPILATVRTKQPTEKLTFCEPTDEDYLLALLSVVQNPSTWLIGEQLYGTSLDGMENPDDWCRLSSSGP